MDWSKLIKEIISFGYVSYKKYNKFKEIGIFLPAKLLRETPSVEKPETKISEKLDNLFHLKWEEKYCFFKNREEDLYDALKEEKTIRVVGKEGIGKTRTTIEVIRRLASKDSEPKREDSSFQEAVLIILHYKSEKYEEIKTYRKWFVKKWPLIILLYDDIDKIIPKIGKEEIDIEHINRKFKKVAKKIKIISTSHHEEWLLAEKTDRKGKEFTPKRSNMELLFNNRVEIPILDKEQYRDVCDKLGKEYKENDYTGIPRKIVYSTPKRKMQYDELENEKRNLMHVIKLFVLGGIYTPKVELVKKVGEDIFKIKKWDDIFSYLKKEEFFSVEEDSIEIHDFHINEVHDYRPDESKIKLKRELNKLIEALTKQKAVEELGDVGEKFISREEYEDAFKCYNNALEFEKKNPYFYSRRGNMYHKLEDLENAKKDYDQSIELKTKKAFVYNNRGVLYYDKKQLDEALEDYKNAIKLDENYATAYYNRGVLYYDKKQLDDALADYNKAIELNENYVTAYHNRGIIYAKMNQYDDALADFNKAIELDENAFAYYNRGRLYSDKKQYDDALADYNKAIELDENDAPSYHNRGRLYYNKNRLDEALADYNKAIELDENLAHAYNSRGFIYFRKENYDLALEDITHAIDIDDKFALAYANRCEVYFYLDEKELAVEDIKIAKKLDPKVLVDNLKYDFLEKELFPAGLASRILSHLEDIYDSFSEDEKKVIADVKIRIST